MARSKQLKDQIKTSISSSLNILDPTPNSKLYGLIDGLVNDLDNFEENEITVLNNMYIETCTENYLDLIAAQEGIQRFRTTSFKFDKSTNVVKLYRTANNTSGTILRKGATFQVGSLFYVVLRENVDTTVLTSEEDQIPVSVDIKVSRVSQAPFSIKRGDSYYLDGTEDTYITITEDIYIPIVEESLEDYRSRIVYSRLISKFGSENALRLCIASSSFVDNFKVDYSTNPISILLFNKDMLVSDVPREDIILYSKTLIETELNKRKADGTAYELKLPTKVSFMIELTPRVLNPKELPNEIYDFSTFIKNSYVFNSNYVIDIQLLKIYLLGNLIDLSVLEDYNIVFKNTFSNFSIPAVNNTILVFPGEYPYLESISLVP